jgi:tetratricopeptide (TPR) repeat protein
MIPRTRALAFTLLLALFAAGTAQASWYDDYDAGLVAAKKGNWSVAVQRMTAAIKGNPKESDRARTYGTIMINYHPYYYRAVAYLNTGKYNEAVADLEKTSGPGPDNLGSIDALMDRAKKMAASDSEPEPAPRQDPVRPPAPVVTQPTPAPVPTAPLFDPALRQRASAALAGATRKLQAAQQRRASTSPQYTQAQSAFNDASARFGIARNNDDYNAVINSADTAGDLADLAQAPAAAPVPAPTAPSASPLIPKPAAAANQVLENNAEEVRVALEQYFAGEFEEATRRFQALTSKMPNNGWIYAFLGASQYSLFAFEGEESYRSAAVKSFRKAKQYRKWNDGLPSKYFSKRIRKAFSEEG